MANPVIRFGWSPDSRTAPTTWVDGAWVDFPDSTATALTEQPRLHVRTRERIYVAGRVWANGEPQDSSTAVVTVAPLADGLASSDGRDRTWWLWCDVIGTLERPVVPLGTVRVYGA